MIGAVSAVNNDQPIANEVELDDTIGVDDSSIIESGNTKDIYVKDMGNDSNTGSSDSPYATIGRAIEDVKEYDDATIYIGEGTFASDGDSNFHIDLDHEVNGNANLKFIGAGADKTIIDGQSAFTFATFAKGTNITIKNITFINCKGNMAGTIYSEGILKIENCIFKDSYSLSSGAGGAIFAGSNWFIDSSSNWKPSLSVKNSQFINCRVNSYEGDFGVYGGGAIFAGFIHSYIENNTFINTRVSQERGSGAAVYLLVPDKSKVINNRFINITGYTEDAGLNIQGENEYYADVINNTFINCTNPSDTYSIVYLGFFNTNLMNNTFINSSNSAGNYYSRSSQVSQLYFTTNISQINVTNQEINNGLSIPVNITDDNGNIIKFEHNDFKIKFSNENNFYFSKCNFNNGILKVTFTNVPDNGIYNLSVVYNDEKSTSNPVTTANISTSNNPIDLYVSLNGSDGNNGTLDSPFATIQHAITVGFEKSYTVIIHLLKGTYSSLGNVNLKITDKGNLRIIGEEYNETIIDGNNSNWFMSVGTTNVTVENLKFVNGNSSSDLLSGSSLYLKDCIVNHNTVQNNKYIMNGVLFDNLVYTNNKGSLYYEHHDENEFVISNGYFANNNNSEMNYGVLVVSGKTIVENCIFINNTAEYYGAAIYVSSSFDEFTSKNNRYEGNTAPDKAVIYVYDYYSLTCNFINDTFINNRATSGNFGATGANFINREYNPTLNFIECRFINNSAVKGGAIGLKQGKVINSTFINNTADYGGAIMIVPIYAAFGKTYNEINFNNLIFENNNAINGKDLYLDETMNSVYKNNFVSITINFNDLNVTSLVDNLTADVIGPCGAQVGGGYIDFTLDGTKIGTGMIINGIASVNYAGFREGNFTLSGNSNYAHENSNINDGTISVKLGEMLNHVEYWVSLDGSDEKGDGSQSNPFNSISYALDKATEKSRNINIHICEGIFTGDLNTALTLSAMNNITLIGSGVEKTIIDGENTTYFATITDGENKIIISDLTVKNMLPDNRNSRVIDSSVPISIEEGITLILNNVELCDNHGGEAIITNNGNLIINNSIITRNGLSSNGIIYGGNITIDNSKIFDNYVEDSYNVKGIISGNIILVNNSSFKGNYIIFNSLADNDFNLIYGFYGNEIENTNISSGGNNESLKDLGFIDESITFNPALTIRGNLNMTNTRMTFDFNGTIYTKEDNNFLIYPHATKSGAVVKIFNSSFINFRDMLFVNGYSQFKYVFDGCLFENLTYIAHTRSVYDTTSQFNITNSVFLFEGDIVWNQQRYTDIEVPNIMANNNYWGNSQSIMYFLGNAGIKDQTYNPDTWVILTTENGQLVFKLTDGENIMDYKGTLPAKISYITENNNIIPVVNIKGVGYKLTSDENGNFVINTSAEPVNNIEPLVPVDETVFASDITIAKGENGNFTATFTDRWGTPLKNTDVSFVSADRIIEAHTDDNGVATFKIDFNVGIYRITITNPGTGESISRTIGVTTDDTISADNVAAVYKDGSKFSATFTDQYGVPLANASVTFKVGETSIIATTDINGTASFVVDSNAGNYNVTIINPNGQSIVRTLAVSPAATALTAPAVTTIYNVAKNLVVTLKDANGNAISNAKITINLNGKATPVTTDKNGQAKLAINLPAKTYTATITYNGDNNHIKSTTTAKVVVNKATPKLTAKKATFKAKTKTKKYSIVLKDNKGKAIKKAKVTLKVKGKTYKAITNSKGKATFKITKLTKKGKHKATIKYKGNNNFKAVTKTIKYITVK